MLADLSCEVLRQLDEVGRMGLCPSSFFGKRAFLLFHGFYTGSIWVQTRFVQGCTWFFFSAEGGFYKGSIEALEQLLIERAWPTIL